MGEVTYAPVMGRRVRETCLGNYCIKETRAVTASLYAAKEVRLEESKPKGNSVLYQKDNACVTALGPTAANLWHHGHSKPSYFGLAFRPVMLKCRP